MAALNQDETRMLEDVVKWIEHVQRYGYDPNILQKKAQGEAVDTSEWSRMVFVAKDAELLRRRVHTLRTMKGYYSK